MELATPSKSSQPLDRDPSGVSAGFQVCSRFRDGLASLGLTSLDAVFAFEAGRDMAKLNIGRFRKRLVFEAVPTGGDRPVRIYLKRYDRPPMLAQIRNWLCHHCRKSFAQLERRTADQLAAAGINTPRVIACGERWGVLFEQVSFLMTEEVRDSRSLESRPPACFVGPAVPRKQRDFITAFASFIRRFHETGYRHRDLYLSHIFCSDDGEFCLIDLARASRPIRRRRFQVKDIAQLHYSAPAHFVTRTDRLRFYLAYVDRPRLLSQDKAFIRKVVRKALRMARHNRKRGHLIPFLQHSRADGQ